MPETNSATKLSLSFAKLVATPTDISWSQAYNAGNLFACISLTIPQADDTILLSALGKDLFNVLQSEFFTLQEKNINTIKTAIQTSLSTISEGVNISLTLAYFKDNILLVFIAGSGRIIMKRDEKIGVLLTKQQNDDLITSASGFIANSDTIILETGQFAQIIPQEIIIQAFELELPNDIVEALSPQMHKQDNGAQAAIVIACRGALPTLPAEEIEADEDPMLSDLSLTPTQTLIPDEEPESKSEPEFQTEMSEQSFEKNSHKPLSLLTLPHFNFGLSFNHRRRLFLNIALILAVLLIISIFFTIKKYHDDKERALFQSIYPPAQQDYSEGKGLTTVNASLSQNSYKKAQTLLQNGETKFSKGSSYYQQIAALLSQVNSAVQGNTAGQSTNATAATPTPNSLLAVEESNNNGLTFGQDDQNVYVVTNNVVETVSKTDGTTKTIIKNNNYWSSPVAIVPYDDNVYVLDQKKGLLKFVAGSGGYGENSYFKSSPPDLSSATGMAIDGSVWLLFKDGSVKQYTKSVSNNLQVSGLLKPLNNPTKLVTDITMENIYILDSGSGRIVKFDKTGKYQASYTSSVLSNAKDFTVDETNKKIQILSQGKVWEMNM